MRYGKKAPDVSRILPSVRKRGVIIPLIVRPNCSPDHFEIMAGRRRYFAALAVEAEGQEGVTLPCAILADGDAADAFELSIDRKSVVSGKSVSVRVGLGGRRIINKKIYTMVIRYHSLISINIYLL